MLPLESSPARMSNLARQEIYYDHFYGLDELIERIEAVTIDDLQQTAEEFFRTEQIAVTILGNLTGLKLTRDHLACCVLVLLRPSLNFFATTVPPPLNSTFF